MKKLELGASVLLSIQRALLGEITPNIRGITCAWSKSEIKIRCYFEGEITDENEESMDCVEGEIMADFPNIKLIDLKCLTINMPESLNKHTLMSWVYMRKE